MSSAAVVAISSLEETLLRTPPLSDGSHESIKIFVAVSGSKSPMWVLDSDSIESVTLQIQNHQGFFVGNKKPKLVCSGRELTRSTSCVRDYGVSDGDVLHLVLRSSDILHIHVRTSCGKQLKFEVDRNRDVAYVKRQVSQAEKDLGNIDDQEVMIDGPDGEKLEDERLINDICKHNNAVVHLFVRRSAKIRARSLARTIELSIDAPKSNAVDKGNKRRKGTEESLFVSRKPPDRESPLEPVIVNPKIELPFALKDLVNSTLVGLEKGHVPVRSSEGTGGAYFMLDASGTKYVAVFKPIDEEPMAINNPRGLPLSMDGEGLKKGTRVGEGAYRECAAYILDHPKSGRRSFSGKEEGFAGVPPTLLIRCLHDGFNHPGIVNTKIGSLQMYMENSGSCEDFGPSSFPVEEVHKIALLDIRLANADRHSGNILLNRTEDGKTVLIPIDHGYCLPESFEDCTFDWLYWPQARQPFSPESVDYITSLNAEEDIALLKFYGWELPHECARIFRISTMILKKGVERGLSPFVIGSIMCRERLNKESVIEEIVREAQDSVLPCSSEGSFMDTVSCIMDHHLDAIANGKR